MGGFAGSQIIRLGSNLILTRMLFPEAFGLAALVSIVLQGLELLSDVGLAQAVIQNRRGDDTTFLNTAWSLQIIRGVILAGLCLLLAYPFSLVYEQPILTWLLAVAAVQVLIQGFLSTSIFTLQRRVHLGQLTLLDFASQIVCVAVMVAWVLVDASVWALIAGGVARGLFRLVASHRLPVGYRNRWQLDPECSREILGFGRWILGSSALQFVSRQADRLIVGKLLGVATLGVYSIAVMLAEVVDTIAGHLAMSVFFPIFSQVGKEGRAELRRVYYRARLYMDAVFVTGVGGLAVVGSLIVELLWDDRYAAAGWMFEALCIRVAMAVIVHPCDRCLLALGEGQVLFYRSVARSVWILVAVPLGYTYAGVEGLIAAVTISELPVLAVLWLPFWRLGMLRPTRELFAVACFATGYLLMSLVEPVLRGWIG
jgi:O-antigen/teichoic acid export membrane protein